RFFFLFYCSSDLLYLLSFLHDALPISARHISARVRHASLDSGPYGFVRDGGGDLRTHSYCRLPSYHDYHVSSRHSVSCRRQSHLDRKSTRLNSSHLGISYAVFCLKKTK